MILSLLTWAGVGPAALLLIAVAVVIGLLCAGCGPSPPAKWTSFRDATTPTDPAEEDPDRRCPSP